MFAITGITGKVGGEVARNLLAGNQPVRAVVRDLRKGEAWAQLGCELVRADINDAGALTSAFKGTKSVFVLVPPNFDFQELWDYPIPLERFGLHWSSSIFRGLRSLRGVDPAQILPMAYEDLVTDPTATLDRLARFMEIDVPDGWVSWAEAAAKRPPSKWSQLAEPERSRLDAACRIANRRLYGPAGPPV